MYKFILFMIEKVLVLGASEKTNRYSCKAIIKLKEYGHKVYAVGKNTGEVRGVNISTKFPNEQIDTVTIYLSPKNQQHYYSQLLEMAPKRIIFNPGAENDEFFKIAKNQNINVLNACTLVMLSIGNF
jgi:predicted CoA-binding protein